ncbi:hypothetical protein SLE2022_349860 [Rubroshorea leprosula]
MAETKSGKEPALPTTKRKADLSSQDHESSSLKAPKIDTHENNNLGASGNYESSVAKLKTREKEPEIDAEEEDGDGDYEDEADDESVNGNAHLDRKGKGILVEEEDDSHDDDDDDPSDSEEESDGDSDLSDDPLAEVDLENILPSRTRRRVVQPGVYIANDLGNKGNDEDSNNSDA